MTYCSFISTQIAYIVFRLYKVTSVIFKTFNSRFPWSYVPLSIYLFVLLVYTFNHINYKTTAYDRLDGSH